MTKEDIINTEYAAMKSAQSVRQIRWISAYTKNPELASIVLDIFDMPEEDIKLVIRILYSLTDGLRLYQADKTYNRKKQSPKPLPHPVAASV